MRPILLIGALLLAAAAASSDGDECDARHKSALVVRAGAPWSLGDGHGDASFRASCWKVSAGWASDATATRVALAIARTCS